MIFSMTYKDVYIKIMCDDSEDEFHARFNIKPEKLSKLKKRVVTVC